MQRQLLPWCEQQGISTELQWWSQYMAAALPDLHAIQWLIHGDTVRAEALLQANSAAAVRRNILATQQLLEALPGSDVPLVLLSSHLAAHRQGVAGSSLAASEALAEQMVRLSGLSLRDAAHPDGDIEIICTGLRPGEKLYEELLIDAESQPTAHPLIYRAQERALPSHELWPQLDALKAAIEAQNVDEALKLLAELVPEWRRGEG